MSAKNTNESAITLPESEGVLRDLLQRLAGKRARLWFNALKRFIQKENPWIKTEKIVFVPKDYGDYNKPHMLFSVLRSEGLNFFDYWNEVLATDSKAKLQCIPEGFEFVPPHSLVSVRVGDLITAEESDKLTFDEILEKAYTEHDLYPCDIQSGLYAIQVLLIRARTRRFGTHSEFHTLCIKPIPSHKERTVPVFRLFNGNHEQSGTVMLRDVDHTSSFEEKFGTKLPGDDYLSPDSRLIFRQISA